MKFALPAILCWVLMVGCNKGVDVPFNAGYHKKDVIPAGGFRLFARSGEIKDENIVHKFLGLDSFQINYVPQDIMTNHWFLDSIRFTSAIYTSVFQDVTEIHCNTLIDGAKIILTDTVAATGIYPYDLYTKSFSYNAREDKPVVYAEYIYSSTRGFYQFAFDYQPKFILTNSGPGKSGRKITAPIVVYVQHSTNYYYSRELVNDKLTADFYNQIPMGDTVSIQEFTVRYDQ